MSSAARLRLRRGGSLFDRVHTELFGSGEQGIYMPSVHESFLRGDLFQDAAGTTPAVLGQPVGLWLDRSKGTAVNLGMASLATGWSLADARWAYTEDSVSWAGGGGANSTNTLEAFVLGPASRPFVELRFRVSNYSGSGNCGPERGVLSHTKDTLTPVDTRAEANGDYVFRGFWFAGPAPRKDISILGRGTNSFTISDFSVRELPGNHAIQPSSSLRPEYQTSPERIDFDGVDDKLTATFASSLGSDCTVGLSIPGSGASILTGQTIDTSYDIDADTCGVVIVDRALTGNETTVLTQLLNKAAEV